MNLDKLYTIHVRLTKATGGLPKRYLFPVIPLYLAGVLY